MNKQEQAALLEQLLATGAIAPPQPAAEPPVSSPPPKPQHPSRVGRYDQVGQSVAYAGTIGIAAALWLAGAYFTLVAIGATGATTPTLSWSLLWWLVPLIITGIEIWLMPRAGIRALALGVFALVLAIDVASSWYGVIDVFGGRFIKLGPGFTVAKGSIGLHVFAVVSALVLAFIPERLARWATAELVNVWR